jgi:hypothetical protein
MREVLILYTEEEEKTKVDDDECMVKIVETCNGVKVKTVLTLRELMQVLEYSYFS